MSKRARPKASSKGYPVKVGTRYVSYYEYGNMLRESGAPRPHSASHPHLLQGWDKMNRHMAEMRLRLEIRRYLQGKFNWLPSIVDTMEPAVEAYRERFGHTL